MGKFVRGLVERCAWREAPLLFARRALPLYSMVTSCGVSRQTTGTSYDWHGLKRGSAEFVLLQHTIAGRGMLAYEGESRELKPGDTMLLFFPHDNRYWLPPGSEWEFFWLCMNGRDVVRLWRDLVARTGPVVRLDEEGAAMQQATRVVEEILDKRLTSPFATSAQAYATTMALFDELVPAHEPDDVPPYIARVIAFCRQHLAEPIGVDDLARAAGLSRYHFTRRFRAARGVSPGKFLAGLRLQESVRLIQDTRLPVRDVAEKCGFADANYFCKVFRRHFGVAPAAFRKSGMY